LNIISEQGKHYLETFIAKIDNTTIDASPLFVDLEDAKGELLKKFNREHKTHFSYLDESAYGYNIQAVLNRFSGNYFSASFLKSYQTNPAGALYSMFVEEEPNSAAQIGTTVHSILEEFYKLPKNEREKDKLLDLVTKLTKDSQNEEKINQYIQGYLDTPDYLTGQEFDHKNLECLCEYKGRSKIYIPKLDLSLPMCSFVIDRIDFRDNDIYIIDYKTGKVNSDNLTFEGNLSQMILYKWLIEQKFKQEVRDVYLCAPGNQAYMKVECSLENQKILAENINKFFTKFKSDNQTRVYTYTDEGYFTSPQMTEFREIMNDNSVRFAKIPVKVYIGEEK
jgi:hypothetical protein